MARTDALQADKVVSLQPTAQSEGSSAFIDSLAAPRKRDWSAALDLVQEACEAIRISEDRVADLEREGQQLALQARDELKSMQAQLHAAERRAQNAETRAEKAEVRAAEAEGWLARLDDAITAGFARVAKPADL